MDQLKGYMDQNPSKLEETWTSVKEISTESILQRRHKGSKSVDSSNRRKKLKNTVFVTKEQNFIGGGSSSVLNGLAAYLRYLEGTARDDWQELHAKLRSAETRDGASFPALFGPALSLGIISRRKVYTEAIRYDRERNGGFRSPFGYSTVTIAAAVNAVCSMEWYWLMARKGQLNGEGLSSTRIWRWNGFLVQAITLLGFGKSEKPSVVYTELLWAELLKDFIIEVVREPVHLVGNSIGGYIASIATCFWPSLVMSIVLINSAGNIVPGYRNLQVSKERRIAGAAWLGARAILLYLKSNIRSIVRNCYPTRPDRADDSLINEMIRASCDPGVAEVLESVFSFDLSLPLNYLLQGCKEQVLIIQGMKDPISNSKSKVAMLKEHCPSFVIKQLDDAGHCPHDEQPDEVNSIVCEWTAMIESRNLAPSFSYYCSDVSSLSESAYTVRRSNLRSSPFGWIQT
ncbi:Pheophytinase, chloroplastic [Linum perenne]